MTLSQSAEAQCPFNVTGATSASADRDGLLLIRVARGVPDSALTQGAGTAQTAAQIRAFVAANKDKLDVDGDGVFSVADATIIARYLKGFKGDALLDGVTPPAIAKGPLRLTGQSIAQYIADGCVTVPLQTVNRPNAFVFTDVHDVDLNSTQTSNTVAIAGLTAAAPIRIVDGEYSIGCSASFTSAAGTISNGQTVCVRNTASNEEGASVNTSLWIGGAQGTFVSTTRYAQPPGLQPIPTATVTQGNYPPPTLTGELAPTIVANANGAWNNANTWNPARVPVDGDIVSIPKNVAVTLSGNTARLAGLWIMGSLDFDRTTVGLVSRYVFVYGRLQAGTPTQPFTQSATFEFTGTDKTHTVLSSGTKGLVVMEGGLLKVHGEQRLSWTKIAANPTTGVTSLPVGSTSMTLIDSPATWRVGDRVLIAATEIDPRKSEIVTITNVSGNNVSFTPGLANARHSVLQTINGKRLDQRPSVSLLTRNIVLKGDAGSDATKFSGHVMIMANGHAQVSGVQFDRMGQLGVKGRYPIHWHIAGDRTGNYVINSSISGSNQRAYVVHSTNNVLVEGNVAYDVVNHAYVWSEDGDEHSNRFIRNVGVLVTSPDEANFIFPINNAFFGDSSQAEFRSSMYWGRSFDRHVIRGNISGGAVEGFGFFFDLFTPRLFSTSEGGSLVFENNTAHSNYKILATGNQINYPERTSSHALMVTTGTSGNFDHVFRNYTAYYNTSGAWFEDRKNTFKNSIVADNGIGTIMLRGVIDGVTLVGKSASPVNTPQFLASVTFDSPSVLHVAGSNHGGKRAPFVRDATVMNHTGIGVLWDVDNVSPMAALENIRFENVNNRLEMLGPVHFEYPRSPMWGWNDVNGSIRSDRIPSRHVVRDSNLINARCVESNERSSYACRSADNLLLKSNEEFMLVDSRGKVAFARDIDYDYYDPGMPASGAISWIASDERYELIGAASTAFVLRLGDAGGKTVEFSIESSDPLANALRNTQVIPLANSLYEMRESTNSMRFYDAVSKRLFVRIVVPAWESAEQVISFAGTFPARNMPITGLAPVAVPANLVDGFVRTRHVGTAFYSQRYSDPLTPPSNVVVSNAALVDAGASDAVLASTLLGTTNVIRAYVFAPTDGVYRLHLWGDGGGTSLYVNGRYVQGEGWAFYNGNFFTNGVPNSEVVDFLHPSDRVSLKAGWHEVTLIHAKFDPAPSQPRLETSLIFRWATPSAPDTWVFPTLKRAP